MRPSQTQRLLDIEQRRSSWRHGFRARVWQLKWATAVSLALYVVSRYHLWRSPRSHNHVWIDGVLVEVLEDGWAEKVSLLLFNSLLLFGSLLVAFLLCVRPERRSARPAHRSGGRSRGHSTDARDDESFDNSTIRPIRRERDGAGSAAPAAHRGGELPASRLATTRPRLDPAKPMRTSADLDSFLERAALEQQRQRKGTSALGAGGGTERGFFPGQPPPPQRSFLGPTEGRTNADGTIHVRYSQGGGGAGAASGQGLDGAPRGLSEWDWEALGVNRLDHALTRAREWVSDLCRRLIAEVDECDRWLAANEAEAYDCGHSLREALQVAVAPAPVPAPAMGGWGGGSFMGGTQAQPQQPQVQTITKQQALVEQRGLIQRSDHRNFDTILRLDQRVALEVRLDVTGTFPETMRQSNAELCARQQYVLQRLRTFAKQRTLASYKHNGGDSDTWREGFPCDAHLLLHLVRTSVDGMGSYVRFGYQGSGDKAQDLAIFVGDTGEPYFYVRYRGPTQDRLYATRPGAQSLFEAILIFAAIIHVNHDDAYGGVRGTMDLKKAGLTKLLREPKFGTAWADTL